MDTCTTPEPGDVLRRAGAAFALLGAWLAVLCVTPWEDWSTTRWMLGACTALVYLVALHQAAAAACVLRDVSLTDPLTGLANRRGLERGLAQVMTAGAPAQQPLALVAFDVDLFKTINDRCGHAAGDRALRMVGGCLRQVCRTGDLAARLGGDEFVIVAPNTSAVDAAIMARRVQDTLALQNRRLRLPVALSLSAGIASTEMKRCVDATSLLAVADAALYLAKEHGRNRLVIGVPGAHRLPAAAPAPHRDDTPLPQ